MTTPYVQLCKLYFEGSAFMAFSDMTERATRNEVPTKVNRTVDAAVMAAQVQR